MAEIAGALFFGVEEAFEREEDPNTGTPWADLSDFTKARRKKQGHWPGKKLQVSQAGLASSINSDSGQDFAQVGTNKVYAPTHQRGAKKGEFGTGSYKTRQGTFPIPWADIPARPFLGLSETTAEEVRTIMARYISGS